MNNVSSTSLKFESSSITYNEQTNLDAFIAQSLAIDFEPGSDRFYSKFIRDKAEERPDIIRGAYIRKINGDGACWVRALWQDVFNQILDNSEAFDAFIQKVYDSRSLKMMSPHPKVDQLVEKIMGILFHLKNLKVEEKRIDYLNCINVDTTLNFFMRCVAAAQIEKEQESGYYQSLEATHLKKIRLEERAFGFGAEITAFASYFNLKTCVVKEKETLTEKEWVYYEQAKGERSERAICPVKELTNRVKIVARLPTTEQITRQAEPEDHLNVLVIPARTEEQLEALALQRLREIKKTQRTTSSSSPL